MIKDDELTLTINGLGSGGEGVAHFQGLTIFIDGALPGETVRIKLTRVKKTHAFGNVLSVLKKSEQRVNPPCPIFGVCGGCQIMHLSYPEQLKFKKQKVVDAIQRIGKRDASIVLDPIPSPNEFGYRNKIQLPVKNGGTLGLYKKNSHELVPLEKCYIHCDLGEAVFKKLNPLIAGMDELRHVLIKSAIHSGQVLVVFVTKNPPSPKLKKLSESVFKIPTVKGVVHNLHNKQENVILGDTYTTLQGESSIYERLLDLTFSISPASFFQVNPLQAENLYLKALEFADLTKDQTVLDAYCGVGTLSLIFAKQAGKVIGVETVRQAIEDAKENALRNEIKNVSFVVDRAEKFIHKIDPVDLLLLNPPRKGCDPTFLEGVKHLRPKKIIYISCDPATLARDLKELNGYRPVRIQPFDMFPQTSHVENVVELLPI